ncbi:hypothetical protein LAZ67_14001911 [Cordylochernes scorpioides]|uniref:Uncharacterized protein n=1 Tax=Cordylochernes scorpioides TaxID=51811 RepID=A0ABY6L6H0_9ARAC|nr:hypothetical protein LAZ67_14001911 [Cordylochernes scorpioides]
MTKTIKRLRTKHYKGMTIHPDGTRTYRTCNNCPGVELKPTHIFSYPAMGAALQKIDIDPEQEFYIPKIMDIAAAGMEMHGDIIRIDAESYRYDGRRARTRCDKTHEMAICKLASVSAMSSFEQRAIIKFCVTLKKYFTDTLALMNEAYENEKLSRTQVYFWYNFKDGRKSIAEDPRSGQPLTSTTDCNIGQVHDLIVADRKITFDNISEW